MISKAFNLFVTQVQRNFLSNSLHNLSSLLRFLMLSQYLSSCTRIERVKQEIYPHLIIIREGFTLIKCSHATSYFPSLTVRLCVNRIWGFMMHSSNSNGTYCFLFLSLFSCCEGVSAFSLKPLISASIFSLHYFPVLNFHKRRKFFAK